MIGRKQSHAFVVLCSYKRCRGSYTTVKLRPFSVESHFDIKYLIISYIKTFLGGESRCIFTFPHLNAVPQ